MSNQFVSDTHCAKLSIVVPITKMFGRLQNLFEWTLISSGRDVEIIFIHDFADTMTSLELRKFIEEHPTLNIRLIEDYYGSPGMARNAGLEKSTSEWIVFWDSDDVPNLEFTLDKLITQSQQNDFVVFQAVFFDVGKGLKRIIGNSFSEIIKNPGIWRIAFRRSRIKDLRFDSILIGEDLLFLIDCGLLFTRFETVDIRNYTYYFNTPEQSTSNEKVLADLSLLVDKVMQRIQNHEPSHREILGLILVKLLYTNIFYNPSKISALKALAKSINILGISFLTRSIIIYIFKRGKERMVE